MTSPLMDNRFKPALVRRGFGYENILNVNGPGLPSLHLSISGLGQGFNVLGYLDLLGFVHIDHFLAHA